MYWLLCGDWLRVNVQACRCGSPPPRSPPAQAEDPPLPKNAQTFSSRYASDGGEAREEGGGVERSDLFRSLDSERKSVIMKPISPYKYEVDQTASWVGFGETLDDYIEK